MKFVSWNVNGLRAVLNKGFLDFFNHAGADVFALQETKLQADQLMLDLPGYHQYFNYAERKGYSGTAVFSKMEPLSVIFDFPGGELSEGRVITLEYENFYFVCAYSPNAGRKLARLGVRVNWQDAFAAHCRALDGKKPVIITGDLNVAHQEIDLKNPKSNAGSAGFTIEERDKHTELLAAGFTDTFRLLYPDKLGAYTWWSYLFNARTNNAGWRIDYFLCSDRIKEKVLESRMHPDVLGSDHCPVELEMAL